MRLPTLSLLLLLASSAHSQEFVTAAFAQQKFHPEEWKTVERYGKSEREVVKMGHDAFVAWYCDPARATQEGRIQAEKVYGLALSECNAPLLERMPRSKQLFMESAISGLSDMAKSSWATAIQCTSENLNWSLPSAEMTAAVSETVYALLNPTVAVPTGAVDLPSLLKQVTARVKVRQPETTSTRLDFLSSHLTKLFKDRPERERTIVRAFTARMLKIALMTPDPG